MKKEMFNVWYNEYGRELAKNALPIDDVDEKDIRRKAKEIFSYTYSLFSEFMCNRLSPIHDHIIDYLENSNEYAEEFAMRKKTCRRTSQRYNPLYEIQKLYKTIQTCIKFDSFL